MYIPFIKHIKKWLAKPADPPAASTSCLHGNFFIHTQTLPSGEVITWLKSVSDEDVRLLAYYKWEQDGCPHGRSAEFWELALQELLAQKLADITDSDNSHGCHQDGMSKIDTHRPAQKYNASTDHGGDK